MDTPLAIRQHIITDFQRGLPQRKIAKLVESNQSTVFRVIKQFKATGEVTNNRKGNFPVKSETDASTTTMLLTRPMRHCF